MTNLLVRQHEPAADGRTLSITPESAGWGHVGFDLIRLRPGERHGRESGDRELCLVLIAGKATITAGDVTYRSIGERTSPFGGKPWSVYVPARSSCAIAAETDLEVAICSAPGQGAYPPRLIGPDQVAYTQRGGGNNTRHVYDILPQTDPAENLLVVEVITPSGSWSSYPPHKHDTATPGEETALEEVYYHRLKPAQGFAFQRVYTDDRSIDQTMTVEDGDCVMVPRGYHPVGAPHGYDLYYLNVMAGPKREWMFRNDPAHDWIVRQA